MCSMNEDVQYESGISSVQVRSAVQARYIISFGTGDTAKKSFITLLIYQVEMVSNLWEDTKIN